METRKKIIESVFTLLTAPVSQSYYRGRRRSEKEWRDAKYNKLADLGSVKKLAFLPLIDWYPGRPDLLGEPGVAYYIKAGRTRILFDLGFNELKEHPSPLLQNMRTLGISFEDIDIMVISHMHPDHIGGMRAMRRKTLAPSSDYIDLSHMKIYTPEPASYPAVEVNVIKEPQVIAPGVASLGPISAHLFIMGRTDEQAIGINVKGKGIVLIVGCGHQGIRRIMERAKEIFNEPIYGLVGGLHFPVTASRINRLGIPLQRVVGCRRPPWNQLTIKEVEEEIEFLKSFDLKLVSLSAHDSCDEAIAAFHSAFPQEYRDLRVGMSLEI